jgi:P4 family phage/plasmid primase-like protien
LFTIDFDAHGTHGTHGKRAGGAGPEETADLQIITVADVKTYMKRILRQELRRVQTSTEGTRNNALNQAAFALGRYVDAAGLNAEALHARLLMAAEKSGLPRREASQTITSALDAGMEEMPPIVFRTPEDIIEDAATTTSIPYQIELRRELAKVLSSSDKASRDIWAEAAKEAGLGGKTALQQVIQDSKPTDADIRDLFLERYPYLIYHPALEWMRYGDPTPGAYHQVPDSMVKRLIVEVLDETDRPSMTASRVKSVAELLIWSIFRPIEDWDTKDVIVCSDCTLDLSTDPPKRRDHRRDDYSTHSVPYAFPKGHFASECPAYLRVVSRLPEEEHRFLQEYIGYCLTRDTRHDVMVWIVGRPGSGKSTLIRGILTALGGHATMVSLRELNRSRFALNAIVGKTLIYGTDVGTEFVQNTDTLNALVSGDPIRIEAKYAQPFEYWPTVKVLWAMTKKPTLGDPDDGLFRRVHLITMPPLPSDQADPGIRRAVQEEGPGILAWAIQGLLRLRRRGHFLVPKSVKAHTTQYRDDQDKTAHFATDCLQEIPPERRVNAPAALTTTALAPDATADAVAAAAIPAPGEPVRAAALYRAYVAWCKISGYNPLGKYKFYDDLRRLDLDIGKHSAASGILVCFSHQLLPRGEWDSGHTSFKLTITDSKEGTTTVAEEQD